MTGGRLADNQVSWCRTEDLLLREILDFEFNIIRYDVHFVSNLQQTFADAPHLVWIKSPRVDVNSANCRPTEGGKHIVNGTKA